MIVDTSALAAILIDEPDALKFATAIVAAPRKFMSAAVLVELGILADNPVKGFDQTAIDDVLVRLKVGIVPITAELAANARAAHTRYGRFSGSKAKLNFGDCFSYALAKHRREPLLFKGDGFTQTDVISA